MVRRNNLYFAFLLGREDFALQFKATRLGPAWLVLGSSLWITSMALILAVVFKQPIHNYFPYLAAGMFCWMFTSNTLVESCESLVSYKAELLNFSHQPVFYIWRLNFKMLMTYSQYLVIVLALCSFFGTLSKNSFILPLSVAIQFCIVFHMSYVLAGIGAYLRDVKHIVALLCQVAPLLSPIVWRREQLGNYSWVAEFNPVYHYVEIVRAPIVDDYIPTTSFIICLAGSAILVALSQVIRRNYIKNVVLVL